MADETGLTAEKIQEMAKQAASKPVTTSPSPLAPKPAAAPKADSAPPRPAFDPQVQKLQGYMRMLGITDVEVGGQDKRLLVDGLNGPRTQAALEKYNADNGLAKGASVEDSLRHMEETIRKNAPEMQSRLEGVMKQGSEALRSDVRGMQVTLNLLKNESLKVDGINGILTTTAYNQYSGKNYAVPTAPITAAPASADPLGDLIEERGWSKPAPASSGVSSQQPTNEGTYQIRTEPVPPTVNVENVAGYGRPQQPQQPQYQAPPQQPRYETSRQNPVTSAREPYNTASGVEALEKTLARRRDLESQGYAPQVAKKLTDDHRFMELTTRDGLGERQARQQVNQESRLADMQERSMRQGQQGMDRIIRQMEQQDRREAAENRRIFQQTGRDMGTLGRSGVILAGGSGTQAGAAQQVLSGGASVLGEIFGNSSGNSRQMGTAMGNVVRGGAILGGATGRDAGQLGQAVGAGANLIMGVGKLLGIGGGNEREMRVIQYPHQTTYGGGYSNRSAGSWESGQITQPYNEASTRGVTEAQRMQIIADYEAQRSRQGLDNIRPQAIYTPGG